MRDNPMNDGPSDPSPIDLERFLVAQASMYATAWEELGRGRKESHWMWFIFPQLEGLGVSPTARHFGIRGVDEAKAYLEHPVLGSRLLECCRLLLSIQGKSAPEILGTPDDLKLRSCVTLFALLPGAPPEPRAVLARFYDGKADKRTLELLGRDCHP